VPRDLSASISVFHPMLGGLDAGYFSVISGRKEDSMYNLERIVSGERRSVARWVLGAGALFATGTFGAAPALAQDDPDLFTGFKVEAVTGYDDVGVDFDDTVFDGGQNSQSGWTYGIGIGYDYQMGPWVMGIEGAWTDSTASRDEDFAGVRVSNPIAGVPTPITTHLEGKAAADLYIGLRGGYTITPKALLYVKGGWSFSKIELDGNGVDNGIPFEFDESVDVDGLRIGVGGEYMFTDNFYAKAEYHYTHYSNGDLDVRGANINAGPLFNGVDIVRHQFILGAGFRF
jgi:outer membrane immunogenic protein